MECVQNGRKRIFIVDDNAANLIIGKNLLKDLYEVYPLSSAEKLFEMMNKVLPDLILLDINMPVTDGYEVLKKLKAVPRFSDVPVIFLTAKNDEKSELYGFGLGAVDYVSKPFSPPLLKKRIENQLTILKQRQTIQHHADDLMEIVQEKTLNIFKLQNAILSTVADLVEFRDGATGGHIVRTQCYMEVMLRAMIEKGIYTDQITDWNLDFILSSAQLHDVGKVAILDSILNKPGPLTTAEYETMKTHVPIGADIVRRIIQKAPDHSFLSHALKIVEAHHEKWDGTGYPAGLKGTEIPLEGRLMAVADVYDALVSWRPYKEAFSPQEAKEIIKNGSNTHFDPVLVNIFLDAESEFSDIAQRY